MLKTEATMKLIEENEQLKRAKKILMKMKPNCPYALNCKTRVICEQLNRYIQRKTRKERIMAKQENAPPEATAKNETARRGTKVTWHAPHSRSIQTSRSEGKSTIADENNSASGPS